MMKRIPVGNLLENKVLKKFRLQGNDVLDILKIK